jgi:hypothetical protein
MWMRIVDIIGIALFLGLILRFGKNATALVAQGGHTFAEDFSVVSLQRPPATLPAPMPENFA